MKIPEQEEAAMDEHRETPAYIESWRGEVLVLLRGIAASLAQLVESHEPSVTKEPAAAAVESPDANEPLPTWILTDARVNAIERAIEQEQRVRGTAYGG